MVFNLQKLGSYNQKVTQSNQGVLDFFIAIYAFLSPQSAEHILNIQRM